MPPLFDSEALKQEWIPKLFKQLVPLGRDDEEVKTAGKVVLVVVEFMVQDLERKPTYDVDEDGHKLTWDARSAGLLSKLFIGGVCRGVVTIMSLDTPRKMPWDECEPIIKDIILPIYYAAKGIVSNHLITTTQLHSQVADFNTAQTIMKNGVLELLKERLPKEFENARLKSVMQPTPQAMSGKTPGGMPQANPAGAGKPATPNAIKYNTGVSYLQQKMPPKQPPPQPPKS